MLKIVLFLLAFFVANSVFSQRNIYPFDDYSKCQIGFLKSRGDTLYPAKFENLKEIVYTNDPEIMRQFSYGTRSNSFGLNDAKAWSLSENNKFGCLSKQGKWILPCKYDSFEFNTRCFQFIAKLNDKYGLVGTGDRVILPFEFDQIVPDDMYGAYDSLLLVHKNNLTGMFRPNGKEFIPAIYQSINRISLYDWKSNGAKNYFLVTKNNLTGLLDKNGEVLIEPRYEVLELLQQEYSSRWEVLFRVQDTSGRFSVFNGSGKQLLPFQEMYINPVYTVASVRGDRSVSFIERTDSLDRKQLVSLTTGKESDWYGGLNFIGDQIYAFSYNDNEEISTWKVLDSSFNTVYSNSASTDRLYYFDYRNGLADNPEYFYGQYEAEGLQVYSEELKSWFGVTVAPSVFSICKTIPLTKKEQKKWDITPKQYYCLLNGKTGKRTPFIYQNIVRTGALNQLYYWCIRAGEIDYLAEEVTIDVYDSSAVFLRTVCLDKTEFSFFRDNSRNADYALYQQNAPLRFIENEEGQKGVIHMNGKRITPCVLDGDVSLLSMKNDSTGLYVSRQNEKWKLFNFQAEPLFDGKAFDQISKYEDLILLSSGDQNAIFSQDLVTMMDSCSKPIYVYNSEPRKLKMPLNQCLIVEKNGFLYLYSEGHFQIMNADVFNNPTAKNEVRRDLFVDPSGKIIVEEPKIVKPKTDNFDQIFVTLIGTDLKIEGYRAKKIQTLKNVMSYRSVGSVLKVRTTDLKEGFINIQTGQWQVKPIYEHLHVLGMERVDAFFAKDSKVNAKKWFIIKPDGTKITEAIFDTTFFMNKNMESQRFLSDGQTGFVNAAFEIATPPIFEKSVQVVQRNVWIDNGNCYLVDGSTGKSFQIKRDLVGSYFPKGYVFLFNDSIQILGMNGSELLPPTLLETAISRINLGKFLYERDLNPPAFPYLSRYQIYCSDNDSILLKMNNQHLIDKAKREVFSLKRISSGSETIINTPSRCEVIPIWVNTRCYSEEVEGACFEQPLTTSRKKQDFSYRNYAIDPSGLIPLTLADLFIEGSGYEAKLDLIIEQIIQRDQIFGANCPDMQGAIKEFKRNFCLGNGRIQFLNYSQQKYITVDVATLKDVLKHTEYFEVVK